MQPNLPWYSGLLWRATVWHNRRAENYSSCFNGVRAAESLTAGLQAQTMDRRSSIACVHACVREGWLWVLVNPGLWHRSGGSYVTAWSRRDAACSRELPVCTASWSTSSVVRHWTGLIEVPECDAAANQVVCSARNELCYKVMERKIKCHSSFLFFLGSTSTFPWRTSRSQTTRGKVSFLKQGVCFNKIDIFFKKHSFYKMISRFLWATRWHQIVVCQDQGGCSQHPTLPGQRGQIRGVDEPSGSPRRKLCAREILAGARRCRAQDSAGEVSWWSDLVYKVHN